MIGLRAMWTAVLQVDIQKSFHRHQRLTILRQSYASLLTLSLAVDSVGLAIGALSPHPAVGLMLCPLASVPFMLVSGFFLNVQDFPVYLQWFSVISPHRYVFEALMAIEFDGLALSCRPTELVLAPQIDANFPFCPFENGSEVLALFSLASRFHYNIGIAACLCGVYRAGAYALLRWVPARSK